jgi:hypothetical protein
MNDSVEKILNQKKKDYEGWKTALSQGERTNDSIKTPQSDFDLLHAIETRKLEKLAKLSIPIWDCVMHRLWHTSTPDFLNGVTAHLTSIFEDYHNIIDRVWYTLGLVLERPTAYDDSVLEMMLSWVEDLLPKDIQTPNASVYRLFVRDFVLEIALVEGVKYELDTPGSDQPCLKLFHTFVDTKTSFQLRGHLPEQQWDDTRAEIEAGLLGYGTATPSWSNRRTIREFDRALSSLAAFIANTAAFIIKDIISAQVYYRINDNVLIGLNRIGLPTILRDGLTPLKNKMWQTRGGFLKALKQAIPTLFDLGNKRWYEDVLEHAKMRKECGAGGSEDDDNTDEIHAIPDTQDTTGDFSLETLCEDLLDADRFATFLDGWKQLSSQERQRLSDKYVLLKIIVMSETVDDLYGAYSAQEGCPQLKCLLSQGISTLAFGAAGGKTAHRWIHADGDVAIRRDTITALGFSDENLIELTTGVDSKTDWNLWRLVYTISFISALCRVDDLFQTTLEEKIDICLMPTGEYLFSLPKLRACLLKKNKEKDLDEEQVVHLIGLYNECLCQFMGSVATLHKNVDTLSIQIKPEGIAAHTAYPNVLLAGYAPNAFTTLYWNLHQGKRLSIDSMRGKQRDLRRSLDSLRRFLS